MKLNATILQKAKQVIVFCIVIVALSVTNVDAQPGDPGGGTKPGEEVPITGIEILVAAGGALGIRKLIQSRKARQ